jgi:hypothetical protein
MWSLDRRLGIMSSIGDRGCPRERNALYGKPVKDLAGVNTPGVGSSVVTEEKQTNILEEFHRLDRLLLHLNSCDDLELINLEGLRAEVVKRIDSIRNSL